MPTDAGFKDFRVLIVSADAILRSLLKEQIVDEGWKVFEYQEWSRQGLAQDLTEDPGEDLREDPGEITSGTIVIADCTDPAPGWTGKIPPSWHGITLGKEPHTTSSRPTSSHTTLSVPPSSVPPSSVPPSSGPTLSVPTSSRTFPKPLRLSDLLQSLNDIRRGSGLWRAKDFCFDPRDRTLHMGKASKPIRLTEKEGALLDHLCQAHGRPIDKNALLRDVWDYRGGVETHTLESHLYRLRQKIASSPFDIRRANQGYVLAASGDEALPEVG